jgi:hypothetical protein
MSNKIEKSEKISAWIVDELSDIPPIRNDHACIDMCLGAMF